MLALGSMCVVFWVGITCNCLLLVVVGGMFVCCVYVSFVFCFCYAVLVVRCCD